MSQPFDNRDYDVQKLAEKDAEIERLKEENKGLEDIYDQDCVTLQEQGDQIERLKAANLALGNEVKLQERENQRVEADNEILRKLIGELADALSDIHLRGGTVHPNKDCIDCQLVQRAREVKP